LIILLMATTACGDGVFKCVYETKSSAGSWDRHCETVDPEDVWDPDGYCDKYQGKSSHCTTPTDTTYCGAAEYRLIGRKDGSCSSADGITD